MNRRSSTFRKLLMAGAFSGRALPPVTSLAIFGDSITDQNSLELTGDFVDANAIGYFTQAQMIMGHPITLSRRTVSAYGDVGDYTFGYGSYSPADLINGNRSGDGVYPLSDIATADPANIFCFCGSNTGSSTVEQLVADILTLWDTFRAAGRRVFAAEILPRASSPSYNSTSLANCYAANALLKTAAASRGIPFLEWAHVVALGPNDFGDPALLGGVSGSDGVHPNTRGAQRLGAAWAAWFAPYVGPAWEPPASGDAAWLTTNPYMSGDVSGIATGWTTTNPVGGTITRSKVTDPDGTVWQRLAWSQPGTYNFGTFRQASGTGTFQAGDIVVPVARVSSQASGWDFKGLRLTAYSTISPGALTARASAHNITNLAASASNVIDPVNGLIVGFPFEVAANTTAMFTYIQAFGSGTFDVRQVGLVKIA